MIYFIIVIIKSNVYTRCYMALNRGTKCKFPCPVCLVPGDEMCKGGMSTQRTTKTMEKVYKEAMEKDTAEERENHLKNKGLRGVEVCRMLTFLNYIYLHYAS
jgi:hypothetical protein